MDFYPLSDLSKWAKKHDVSELLGRCIMKQVLNAIAYMHSLRVAHRDIKMSNVLIKDVINDRHMFICLSDFGISSDHTNTSSYIGTKYTIPPEIASEDRHKLYNTRKVDVWCIGIMAYRLLTKTYPFAYNDNTVLKQEQQSHAWKKKYQ